MKGIKFSGFSLLPVLLAVILFLSGCLGSEITTEISYKPGIYYGSAQAYRGTVHVRVEVSFAGIEGITIIDHRENPFTGVNAMEELIEVILMDGITDIDVISGATFSSLGLLEAVENALLQAR